MKALIQRVSSASVVVAGETVGAIDAGMLVLLGVAKGDDRDVADKLVHKLLNYRVFADQNNKMNDSVLDCGAGILLVSQFTLVADTRKGMRPGFSAGASPALAEELYDYVAAQLGLQLNNVQTGVFAADMQVSLVNDGPVTFMLEVEPQT